MFEKENIITPKKSDDFPIRALAILAVRHGRELADRVVAIRNIPVGNLSQSQLIDTLRRLENSEVTESRDVDVFEALRANWSERMLLEIVGSTVQPQFIGYDEDGEVWDTVETPLYSGRGERVHAAFKQLELFLGTRQ